MPLDPQIAELLAALARADFGELDRVSFAALRASAASVWVESSLAAVAETRVYEGPGGPLELQVWRPSAVAGAAGARQCGGLLFYAGAGFVLGALPGQAELCAKLAAAAGCVVISVQCRLAPEHPFPAAVDDAYAALCFVHEHAEDFGFDHTRLAVAGASSGATLATAAARLAKERRNPPLALQLLLYPFTDLRAFETPSHRAFAQTGPFSRAALERFAAAYASVSQRADPRCSPLCARNLIGLPRTLIVSAECDPLRDEAEAYADALRAAHVPVTLSRYAGMVHGFALLHAQLPAAAQALEECAAALRQAIS